MTTSAGPASSRIPTGVEGLDEILGGGLQAHRLYLVQGEPGTGKSTIGLQFLLEGVRHGEHGLYVTLSETADEVAAIVTSHGWTLDGVDVFDLAAAEAALNPKQQTMLLHSWEVELGETVKLVTDEIERIGASRVVFDSMSELRLLAEDPLRFRHQALALKQFLMGRGSTVLFLDDLAYTTGSHGLQLNSLCHGVITLERTTLDFGATRRRLEVAKMRASPFREGWHDCAIGHGGLRAFPRLVATRQDIAVGGELVQSGLSELDAMLHGGPSRGTCMLLAGPSGSGKSTLASHYIHTAAARGEHCAVYEFDERPGTFLCRMARLGLNLQPHVAAGRILLRQVDLAEISPGEFEHIVRDDVTRNSTGLVFIDSLSGYLTAISQERHVVPRPHELFSFLNQSGVLTLIIKSPHGLVPQPGVASISHLANTILLLNFFEVAGHIRKGLSVIKNRGSGHEDTIRELLIAPSGVRLGKVLTDFQGILGGNPTYLRSGDTVMAAEPLP